jgi:glycine cleavage system protein P-like pyridoxal-binding family
MSQTVIEDKASVQMAIGIEGGKVIQRFKEPMLEVHYMPQNAIDIAGALADCGFEAMNGVKPVAGALKTELIERHRDKLIQRFPLVLRSMLDSGKTDGYISKELIDIAFKEIFT